MDNKIPFEFYVDNNSSDNLESKLWTSKEDLEKLTITEISNELKKNYSEDQLKQFFSSEEELKKFWANKERVSSAMILTIERKGSEYVPKTLPFMLLKVGIKPFYLPISMINIDFRYLQNFDKQTILKELENQKSEEVKSKTKNTTPEGYELIHYFLTTLDDKFRNGKLLPYKSDFKKLMMSLPCSLMQGREPYYSPSCHSIAKQITEEDLVNFMGRKIDDELINQGVSTYNFFNNLIEKAIMLRKVLNNNTLKTTEFTRPMMELIKFYAQAKKEQLQRQFILNEYDKIYSSIPHIQLDLGFIDVNKIKIKSATGLFTD